MLEPHPPSNIVNKKITNEKMAREKKGTISIIYFAPFLPTRLRYKQCFNYLPLIKDQTFNIY